MLHILKFVLLKNVASSCTFCVDAGLLMINFLKDTNTKLDGLLNLFFSNFSIRVDYSLDY